MPESNELGCEVILTPDSLKVGEKVALTVDCDLLVPFGSARAQRMGVPRYGTVEGTVVQVGDAVKIAVETIGYQPEGVRHFETTPDRLAQYEVRRKV